MSAPIDLAAMFAQLEAAEAIDAENQRIIALASRIEKIALPALIGTGAALAIICLVSQAMKWIAL